LEVILIFNIAYLTFFDQYNKSHTFLDNNGLYLTWTKNNKIFIFNTEKNKEYEIESGIFSNFQPKIY
jgi:hypothetical protein